ncbi:hypothetical protein L6452_21996 [Arctium lappa]|uniref:Uncharacterized protein n=1 Tax=Arctium lappa TaxID=4217 RepID=A0ACB9AZU8_ARCLA|nr:hypothetical protein L6452_21996 [Arctium lappa]
MLLRRMRYEILLMVAWFDLRRCILGSYIMMDLLLVLGSCVADSLMIPNIEFYQHDDELVRSRKLVDKPYYLSITTGPHLPQLYCHWGYNSTNLQELLALAALCRSNEEHQVVDFERYLNNILYRQHLAQPVSELTIYLDAIDQLVNKLVTPTVADMKHIDRKLKYCRDPGSHEK